jgi:ParB family chromosome partitioning protein
MAKRRRLEAPAPEALAELAAGFAAKPQPDRAGLAPIAQIAAEAAALSEPLDPARRVALARDGADAEAWRSAQAEGRVILDLPLDAILAEHLPRDRMVVEETEMEELKASIRLNGLRLPVEVVPLAEGGYGLISGWRRLWVVRALHEAGEGPATVRALVHPPRAAGALYTAMVEENELRAQLSPYERGRIAVVAAMNGAFPDPDTAVDAIFAAASKSKRSKIRSFAYLCQELGDMLKFPTDLSERNGLRLVHALREGYGPDLRYALIRSGGGAAREWALIEPIVAAAEAVERPGPRGGRPKTAFAKPSGNRIALANGITMERVLHEDGYSIRLRGTVVDGPMVELLMNDLRHWLEPLPPRF